MEIKKQVEEIKVSEADHKLKSYMSVFPGAFVQFEPKNPYKLIGTNDGFLKMHNITKQQAELEKDTLLLSIIHKDDFEFVFGNVEKLDIETNPSIVLSFRVVLKDRTIKWIKAGFSLTKNSGVPIVTAIGYDVTMEKNLERELVISDERLRIVLKQSKTRIWEYDISKRTLVQIHYNQDSEQKVAVIKNVPESIIEDGTIHPESAEDVRELYTRLSYGEKVVSIDVKQKDSEGEYQLFKITYTNIFDEKGKPVRAIGTLEYLINDSEIKERYRREITYRDSINPDLITSYRINFTRNWVECYKDDYDPDEERTRNSILTYEELIRSRVANFATEKERNEILKKLEYHNLLENYKNGISSVSVEYQRKISSGKIVWVLMIINLMKEPNSADIIGFAYVSNIDERKKTELSLKERAERDDLTGLYSRRTLELMISDSIETNCNKNMLCALLMIDLDNFKAVNDTFGHVYGDRVLTEFAKIMGTFLGEQAIAGRLGGDEFVIFVKNVPSKEWIENAVNQLCSLLDKTYKSGEDRVRVTSSMGAVLTYPAVFNYKELITQADLTMYEVKQKGKNATRIITYAKADEK